MLLGNFIESLSRIEDKEHLFRPEYLRMGTDEDEAEPICARCEKCTTPEDYCWLVTSHMEEKASLLSAANRILDALQKRGHWILHRELRGANEKYSPDFWDSDYGEEFCRKCREYGKANCPEDVYSPECARRETVKAVERVLSAVDELI